MDTVNYTHGTYIDCSRFRPTCWVFSRICETVRWKRDENDAHQTQAIHGCCWDSRSVMQCDDSADTRRRQLVCSRERSLRHDIHGCHLPDVSVSVIWQHVYKGARSLLWTLNSARSDLHVGYTWLTCALSHNVMRSRHKVSVQRVQCDNLLLSVRLPPCLFKCLTVLSQRNTPHPVLSHRMRCVALLAVPCSTIQH